MIFRTAALIVSATIATTACQDPSTAPRTLSVNSNALADRSTGDTPNYNLELILRPAGSGDGFGHVKFRQAQDDNAALQRIDLGVWVRDLAPRTEYLLQRATDGNLNGVCTGTNWLTLGEGSVPQSILTDDQGTAKQDLFRVLTNPPTPEGTTFDIMRIIRKDDASAQPVLISDCYQFTVK
jgi:hypothetical protein